MLEAQESHNALASLPAPISVSSASIQPFLDISPDALVIINRAGVIVLANRQMEAVFGYPPKALTGQSLELLLPQRFHEAHVAHREHYFSSPHTRAMGVGLNLVGLRKDNTEFPVEISLSPLLLDGSLHTFGAIRDMTIPRAAERERLQQLQHIRLQADLINLAHDAILVRDPVSRVLSWNKGAEELYGWTAQEAQGRVSHTLLKTRFPISRAAVDAQLKRDGQWEGELVHTCRDGSHVTVESRQALVHAETTYPGATLEINRDITQRRRREQTEHEEYASTTARLTFLQQILDALPSSVYLVYGLEARLLLANREARNVWGAEWPVDQPMLEFLSTNKIALFDERGRLMSPDDYTTLRAVRHGETILQQQETIRRPGGSSLPVLVNALALESPRGTGPLSLQGEKVALVVHQDVTTLKEAEYLKDEFVSIAAHELRTPLAALKGFADMLLIQTARGHGPALAKWQNEALDEIDLAVTRLADLTNELLDVTRLQAGRLFLQRTPTNLITLAHRVTAHLQPLTTRHQLEVHATPQALVADVDPGRIEQVLTNLIGNAIKYSPQGGPVTISLWEKVATHEVGISIKDRGIGIPQGQHAQIFGRFMRADNAQAWGISGTGLGLYISRELVEQHTGSLWFESEEGTGSTFFLTLPMITNQVSGVL